MAQISAGVAHSCALMTDGTVRCWGRNAHGQLGLGHTQAIGDDEPAIAGGVVDLGGSATQVAAGGEHSCALMVGGAVRCWGLGIDGQLGYANVDDVGDDELPSAAGDVPLGGVAVQITAVVLMASAIAVVLTLLAVRGLNSGIPVSLSPGLVISTVLAVLVFSLVAGSLSIRRISKIDPFTAAGAR